MNKTKDKIIKMGGFTINPILLKNILTPAESYVFDIIIHFEDIKHKYVSYSMIEIYTTLSKNTIAQMKNNLIQLNFISVVNETKKGTVYKIEWNVLYNLLKQLNEESNTFKRLLIANEYRTTKGLKSVCETAIKKYEDSPFNFDLLISQNKNEINVEQKEETKIIRVKNNLEENLLCKFNALQMKISESTLNIIDKNDLNNELNRLKRVAKQKNAIIILNRNTNTWEQKK